MEYYSDPKPPRYDKRTRAYRAHAAAIGEVDPEIEAYSDLLYEAGFVGIGDYTWWVPTTDIAGAVSAAFPDSAPLTPIALGRAIRMAFPDVKLVHRKLGRGKQPYASGYAGIMGPNALRVRLNRDRVTAGPEPTPELTALPARKGREYKAKPGKPRRRGENDRRTNEYRQAQTERGQPYLPAEVENYSGLFHDVGYRAHHDHSYWVPSATLREMVRTKFPTVTTPGNLYFGYAVRAAFPDTTRVKRKMGNKYAPGYSGITGPEGRRTEVLED